MTTRNEFTPDWASPPGDTVADALEELGLTTEDLATDTLIPLEQVQGIIDGSLEITADIARKLSTVLGEPEGFWLRRQIEYREAVVKSRSLVDVLSSSPDQEA